MISDILLEGEANAQSGREIGNILGLSIREVCKAIEDERRQGIPICASSSGNNPGYYLASNAAEVDEYCKRLKHREQEIAKTRRACERTKKTLRERGPV